MTAGLGTAGVLPPRPTRLLGTSAGQVRDRFRTGRGRKSDANRTKESRFQDTNRTPVGSQLRYGGRLLPPSAYLDADSRAVASVREAERGGTGNGKRYPNNWIPFGKAPFARSGQAAFHYGRRRRSTSRRGESGRGPAASASLAARLPLFLIYMAPRLTFFPLFGPTARGKPVSNRSGGSVWTTRRCAKANRD
jgi:hypothetical protein